MRTFLGLIALLAVGALASPIYAAASANLVVMSTDPNGAPSVGHQYLLGIQVAGVSGPTYLGSNLVTFSGNLGHSTAPNAFTASPGSFYHGPDAIFQSESDLGNSTDSANYKRTSDSYFAGTWQTVLSYAAGGGGETATSLFIDGGISNVLPAQVAGNGAYPFAYINVTSAPGVEISGTFAIGSDLARIGGGHGLTLSASGVLTRNGLAGDFDISGVVNNTDLLRWKSAFNVDSKADADDDGDSDGADFLVWQRQLELSGSIATVSTVPEPASCCLLLVGLGACRR